MPLTVKPLALVRPPQAGSFRAGAWRALAVLAACSAVGELIWRRLDLANVVMVYLAGIAYVALREDPRVSVPTVAGSILLFDMLFVPPRWGLNPFNPQHIFTFFAMLAVGLLITWLSRHAREQAVHAQSEAVAAERERLRSTLLSGISHDFRTPLAAIVGAATTLVEQQDRLEPPARAQLAAGIAREAQRLHRLTSGLLELTRIEEGAVEPDLQWCPAEDMVQEAIDSLRPRLSAHALRLDVQRDAIVWCDPRLLVQALVNLLDNALSHTPPGTAVRVLVRIADGEWSLVVEDDGPGLPPGMARHPFAKFQRRDAEPARTGFGLGLAICAAIARLHLGRIEAGVGPGARIALTLPQPPMQALREEQP